jgi:hypothetical protein
MKPANVACKESVAAASGAGDRQRDGGQGAGEPFRASVPRDLCLARAPGDVFLPA